MRVTQKMLITAFAAMSLPDRALVTEFMGLQTLKSAPVYFTRKQIEAGEGHPCALGCKKLTRSIERSLRHATTNAELKEFGHIEVS